MALTGKTNPEKIWNYCINAGLSEFGTAGLMGNLFAESGLIPTNLQNSCEAKYTDVSYTAVVDNGSYTKDQFSADRFGYGICQWSHPKRKLNLYNFAKAAGKSIGDLEMQLNFLMKELRESYPSVLNTLVVATSVRAASDVVLIEFERPANRGNDTQIKRAGFGQKYYTEFVTNKQIGGVEQMGYITTNKGSKTRLSNNFVSTEFDCHGKNCCTQTMINEQLVTYLEKIRSHFGKPINLNSGYRCQIHNQKIGGAKNSRHTKGDAADISIKGVEPREVARYAESIGIMGIGLYETSSDGRFVHIDTRTKKSFWYGQNEEPRTTFGGGGVIDTATKEERDRVLKLGCSGDDVKDLQEKLIKLGYSCGSRGADGEYGIKTEIAVRRFQKVVGISVDGIAGAITKTAIDEAIAEYFVPGDTVLVTASKLNVRSGAGLDNPIIRTVRNGGVYTLSDVSGNWGKLRELSGWVSLRYCKKV